MGTFNALLGNKSLKLVKYGAVLSGYCVVGLPVFGSKSAEYLKGIEGDSSAITRDYVRNYNLLINFAKV